MKKQPTEKDLAIFLNLTPGLGSRSFHKALEGLEDFKELAAADHITLRSFGFPPAAVNIFREGNPASMAEEEKASAARLGASVITFFDEDYPRALKEIYDPPPVLYIKGRIEGLRKPSVAVVGSRRPTPYGLEMAGSIGRELADGGFNVVSGMARGIDTAAHKGALERSGFTTAVFGCGLDIVYPPENRHLMEEITRQGSCLTEFPLGLRPDRYTFPRRNRIISGLCLGVIVVEAAGKSGALITAEHALEQGREVFAVPGPIGNKSEGCHRLIKEGARLFEKIDDLLEELTPLLKDRPAQSSSEEPGKDHTLSAEEKKMFSKVGADPLFIDELAALTGLSPEAAASALLSLEIKGCVRQFPGKRFIKTRGGFDEQ